MHRSNWQQACPVGFRLDIGFGFRVRLGIGFSLRFGYSVWFYGPRNGVVGQERWGTPDVVLVSVSVSVSDSVSVSVSVSDSVGDSSCVHTQHKQMISSGCCHVLVNHFAFNISKYINGPILHRHFEYTVTDKITLGMTMCLAESTENEFL